MISLEQIQYFLAIVRYGSLNKASEHLYISQPSLSKQLQHLEKELGCKLLIRNYDGIEATSPGKLFYEQMSGILEEFDRAIDKVRHFDEVRQLRVGGLGNLVTYFLPRYIERLKAGGRNQVTVDTRFSNEELVKGVESGKFDLVLLSNAEPQQNLAVIPLMTEPLYVVFPVAHPLRCQQSISFMEIVLHEKLVLYKDPCTIRASIRRQCNRMKVTPNIVLELDLTESLLRYVSHGDGITLLPSIVAKGIQDPSIATREISRIPIYREISVAMKKENVPSYLPMFSENIKAF
ncbi:LysR family transcriptional regulator [Ethanoligenens harbinense]|uniref:Transcriptional regulator, LysR family n=1 Tax=Ethanoligenens harbinense (strain DSM 18485 / JCM 12961 / CGMCC 1.5033 / YUAN-3) TaxID=663278 RepID=E6U9D3_ETHHY|nr:LysR family transcriptional regulator [Ethanoligenens harbinense]ADU26124.1 transcriptional regulator, LysR family [Ethanoligenens harbinense YUAN-3]AVQ95270.1 LysR family transcriptional regulator [Ethanoligenens harbinense YUAN-3]AYF40680.1 LysR family transcriptional regulator [Ethanoligenens harbinense]QCN91515.1 LysR family transcriptional regulator [Ethanoligenens harbinense]